MASQVTAHETVISFIDLMLLPSTTSRPLRVSLEDARTKVAHHLLEAQTLADGAP